MAHIGGLKKRRNKDRRKSIGADVDYNARKSNSASGNAADKAKKSRRLDRKRLNEKERIRKIADSLDNKRVGDKSGNYSIELNTRGRSFKGDYKNDSGVGVKSVMSKDRGEKIIRIKQFKLDEASKLQKSILKDTINAFQDKVKDDAEFGEGDLRKIQFNLDGIDDIDLVSKGIQELDDPRSVEFIYKNKKNIDQNLEEGINGILKYMETASGNREENDKLETIRDIIKQIGNEQQQLKSEKKVDEVILELQAVQNNLPKVVKGMGMEEKIFFNGLNSSVLLEIGRLERNLFIEKERIYITREVVEDKFSKTIFDIKSQLENKSAGEDIRIGRLLEPLIDISNAARLTPEEIDILFENTLREDRGRIRTLLEKQLTSDESESFKKFENDLREEMAIAIALLGKPVDPTNLPDVFSSEKINTDPPELIEMPKEGKIIRIKKFLRIGRVERQEAIRKGKILVGDLKPLNSDTASDVYTVTTEGNIGFSGTNEGFAKKTILANEDANATTDNLDIDKEGGKLKENPNLIARQVVSSRLDKALRIFSLADEVFSRDNNSTDPNKSVIGITAMAKGKSIYETSEVSGLDKSILLRRNFDFSNPNTQKGLSDLQLMDALTGQMDRHGGNIFIDPKTGKVTGIDNDMAFSSATDFPKGGGNYLRNQFKEGVGEGGEKILVYQQNIIDAETGEKILKMKRNDYERILRGEENDPEKLSEESIGKALLRFDAVKAKVKELKSNDELVKNWTQGTYQKALDTGGGSKIVKLTLNEKNVKSDDKVVGKIIIIEQDASQNEVKKEKVEVERVKKTSLFNNYVARSVREIERSGTPDSSINSNNFIEVKAL